MSADEFKALVKKIRDRWPSWKVSETELKDLQRVFQHEDSNDAEAAVFMVRSKFSSDVPRLPWFINAIGNIKHERDSQQQSAAQMAEAERVFEEERILAGNVERGHKMMVEFLKRQPDQMIDAAVAYCQQRQYIPTGDYGDVQHWSRFSVGMVYAYLSR